MFPKAETALAGLSLVDYSPLFFFFSGLYLPFQAGTSGSWIVFVSMLMIPVRIPEKLLVLTQFLLLPPSHYFK